MWMVAIPIVVLVGVVPFILRHHNKRVESDQYVAVGSEEDDVEMGESNESDDECPILESTVCDVINWLRDARARLDITDEPIAERVDTGSSIKATRITFSLKNGRREIWLDGPAFMQPLPRIRDVEWKGEDSGIEFVRSAAGVEKAVLESYAKRG